MVTKEVFGRQLTADDHILIATTWPEPTEWVEQTKKEHPGIRISYHQIKYSWIEIYRVGVDLPAELFEDVTIFVTMKFMPKPKDAPKLEIVSILSAGINQIQDSELYQNTDITITSSNGVSGPQIAEWVMGHVLAHAHKFRLLDQWQKEHHWGSFSNFKIRDLVKQRIGIFSYGSIGRQCGRVAHALGMEVHAYTASPRPTPESRRDDGYIVGGTGDPEGEFPVKWYSGADRQSFHDFLKVGFDVILLSVPLTDATKGLMGREEFEILQKTGRNPFLVNISRGKVVVTEELERALKVPEQEGGLRGAAVDVVDPEPLPKDHTLWDAPNIYISPHISGAGDDYFERCLEIISLNLRLRASGKRMINVVDRKKGY